VEILRRLRTFSPPKASPQTQAGQPSQQSQAHQHEKDGLALAEAAATPSDLGIAARILPLLLFSGKLTACRRAVRTLASVPPLCADVPRLDGDAPIVDGQPPAWSDDRPAEPSAARPAPATASALQQTAAAISRQASEAPPAMSKPATLYTEMAAVKDQRSRQRETYDRRQIRAEKEEKDRAQGLVARVGAAAARSRGMPSGQPRLQAERSLSQRRAQAQQDISY
jgi:hypothetical protein